jgi:hypothetical protein
VVCWYGWEAVRREIHTKPTLLDAQPHPSQHPLIILGRDPRSLPLGSREPELKPTHLTKVVLSH